MAGDEFSLLFPGSSSLSLDAAQRLSFLERAGEQARKRERATKDKRNLRRTTASFRIIRNDSILKERDLEAEDDHVKQWEDDGTKIGERNEREENRQRFNRGGMKISLEAEDRSLALVLLSC